MKESIAERGKTPSMKIEKGMWKKLSVNANQDYVNDYGGPDYENTVVLDIGCALHTPDFFLSKGAGHVIAIDIGRMEDIIEYAEKFGQVTPLVMKIENHEQLEELYLKYWPDVVKLDCEGCEAHILRLNENIFRIPEWYVMETHDRGHRRVQFFKNHNIENLHGKIKGKLKHCGYEIVFDVTRRHDTGILKAKRLNL